MLKTFCVAIALTGTLMGQATASIDLDKVYSDESHCLTLADMRGNEDNYNSCYCRDAIVDARYVYFTYFLSGKDRNLTGTYLTLFSYVEEKCGKKRDAKVACEEQEWSWDGPEVSRTYPSDEVIKRITPERKDGRPIGRWVPFTVQLIYRDKGGRVVRTENYASRELFPMN